MVALLASSFACEEDGSLWLGALDQTPIGGGGGPGGSGPDPVPDPTGNPTSYDLIDAAEAAGAITTEQALIYKMYVEYDDPALPPQFMGDDTGLIEGDAQRQVLQYVDTVGLGNVDPATLDALWPFFVPAYFEGSWWDRQNPGAQPAQAQSLSYAPAGIRTCTPFDKPWEVVCLHLDSWKKIEGTNVVVWYVASRDAIDGPRANMLAQEYDNTIWPKLTTLMGRTPLSDAGTGLISETDGRLDVVLIDMPANKEGRTDPATLYGCKAVPAHIYLNRNLPDHGLVANAAHELMHAIQDSYAVKAQCVSDYHTIVEATAAWATHYVYPTNDWEHSYAKHYLTNRQVSISYDDADAPDVFRYGAYLLPLFLESRFGASIVKEIWDKTLDFSQELYAIDGALVGRGSAFDKEWPGFIAANWNRDIPDTYLDRDRLTAQQADLEVDLTYTMPSSGVGNVPHNVGLPHASSSYYRVKFGGSDSRSVMFVNGIRFKVDTVDSTGLGNNVEFTGLDALARYGASMQVYLKVAGAWQSAPVDLTNFMWILLCRDDPAGNVDEAIFMYGNAEISPSAPNYSLLTARSRPPGLLVTNVGCRDWTGNVDITDPLTGGQERLVISNLVLKNVLPTAAPTPSPGGGPPLPYPLAPGEQIWPGFGYVYKIDSGTATWTYDDQSPECTYTGRWSAPIASLGPAYTFSNFTPAGSAAHGLAVPGLLILQSGELSYDWRCVDSQGQVTTGTDVAGTSLDIHVEIDDPAVRISNSTGLSVSGTANQTNAAGTATGTWSLQGAVN